MEVAQGASTPELARRARSLVLDFLACALVGSELPYTAPSFATLGRVGGAGESTGPDGVRRPAFVTAYLSGMSANALDYDDTLYGHPGAPIVGAALAEGERCGASLGDLLRAVAVGYQVHWMLGRAATPSTARAKRVRGVGVFDAVASAAACAVIRGADADRLARSIAVAGTQSCVPYVGKWYERPMPTVKNNLGWSGASGLLASELADAGAVGLPNLLDGDAGFWAMAGSDRWQWQQTMSEDTIPALMRTGFKRFPACWHVQGYLRALDLVLTAAGSDARATAIEISGPHDLQKFAEPGVSGAADVAFSIRTLASVLATRIPPGPEWVDPATIADCQRLLKAVTVQRTRHRSVRATFADGSQVHAAVPKGDFSYPYPDGLPEEEVRAKFDRVARPILGDEQARGLGDAVTAGSPGQPLTEVTRWLQR